MSISTVSKAGRASTHKTPAFKRWLLAHPRFVLRFTPTSSSWLNLVQRWFGELTTKKLCGGTHTSVLLQTNYRPRTLEAAPRFVEDVVHDVIDRFELLLAADQGRSQLDYRIATIVSAAVQTRLPQCGG